jgi:hypothetical protein
MTNLFVPFSPRYQFEDLTELFGAAVHEGMACGKALFGPSAPPRCAAIVGRGP